ncbi:MAG: histidinol-phosphatase [Solirubrobacterales bacterium]|nr:histidinol-phosphatase [Solirubrobacterales bacterium]
MLTDYHVHLRPDGPDTPAAEYFTQANAERYRETAEDRGITELGVSEHIYRFSAALDVWQHDLWRKSATDDIDAYCAFVRDETDLRLGIEADFIPGREDQMADLLDARDWDYVIGSIHFLGEKGAVDHADYDIWGGMDSPEKVWRTYFTWLGEAAMSGLFDVLAHPDLVKHWGRTRPFPEDDLRHYYELAMDGIAASGIAIEVSTAGLRKPVNELYPSPGFLEMCIEAGNPIVLSSDAHTPDVIGYGYQDALQYLADMGITELCTFDRRRRELEVIG